MVNCWYELFVPLKTSLYTGWAWLPGSDGDGGVVCCWWLCYGGPGLVNRGSVELRFYRRGLPLCIYSRTVRWLLHPLTGLLLFFFYCKRKKTESLWTYRFFPQSTRSQVGAPRNAQEGCTHRLLVAFLRRGPALCGHLPIKAKMCLGDYFMLSKVLRFMLRIACIWMKPKHFPVPENSDSLLVGE